MNSLKLAVWDERKFQINEKISNNSEWYYLFLGDWNGTSTPHNLKVEAELVFLECQMTKNAQQSQTIKLVNFGASLKPVTLKPTLNKVANTLIWYL